jgi:tetratricopeptide (TPR) repeat protein
MVQPAPKASTTATARLELEHVLGQMRDDPERREAISAGEQDFQKGLELYAAGDLDEGVTLLTRASSSPRLRFVTAALLARIQRARGLTADAIVWFEQASQAPPTSSEEGHALLYEFADLLESSGADTRALDTFIDLQADVPDYRDVSRRVARLMPAAARG